MITQEMKIAFEKALNRLAEYDSAEEIALYLNSLGIKGERMRCATCPVARYLQRAVPDTAWVDATDLFCTLGTMEDLEQFHLVTPRVVAEFISYFDHRRYPYLEIHEGAGS